MAELSPEVALAWAHAAETLRELGAELVNVSLPRTREALAVYYTIALAGEL